MEDNDNRAQQQHQWTVFISVPLCLSLFSTHWCSRLISLSPLFLVAYLYPFPSLVYRHSYTTVQDGGVLNYSNSWQKASPLMITNIRASIDKCLFMDLRKMYHFLSILMSPNENFVLFLCLKKKLEQNSKNHWEFLRKKLPGVVDGRHK